MAGVQPVFGYPALRISYTCSVAVTGGQIVERVAGVRLVQPAGAGSLVAAGVAMWDVPAVRATVQGPQVGDGNELDVVRRCVVLVTYAAAATEGQKLIAAAAGQVTPVTVATQDPRTIVGEAFEAVGAGGTGLAFIY